MIDKELNLFKKKLKSIPIWMRFKWTFAFLIKLSIDVLNRKALGFLKKRKKLNLSRPSDSFDIEHVISEFIRLPQRKFNEHGVSGIVANDFEATADKIINGEWRLAGKEFIFNQPYDWSAQHEDEQDWHSLHRHRELIWVAKALEISPQQDKYWNYIKSVLTDWIYKNPIGTMPGWHPYSLSERLIHWSWVLQIIPKRYFKTDTVWLGEVLTSINDQSHFLHNNIEWHLGNHNHILNDARALLTLSACFPFFSKSTDWFNTSDEAIQKMIPQQVLQDGVHGEQSSSYHFLLTRTIWEYQFWYAKLGVHFSHCALLEKMISYSNAIIRNDGTIPLFGHISPDWPVKELTGLLPLWNNRTDLPVSLLGYFYGYDSDQVIIHEEVSVENQVFAYSGIGILKSDNFHVTLSADPRCRVMVHGDQNMLGLDVWWDGNHLIRDAGLTSYNSDENRKRMESWLGQSTYIINGVQPLVADWRRRQLPKQFYTAIATLHLESNTLTANHSCYERFVNPVEAKRKIILADNSIMIQDDVTGKKEFEYQTIFNLGDNKITRKDEHALVIENNSSCVSFRMVWSKELTAELKQEQYALDYGVASMGTILLLSGNSLNEILSATVKIEMVK